MITENSYRELSAQLDAAFIKMEVAWIEWRDSRPNDPALNTYLKTLAECHDLHQILKSFPQYEPFTKNFPTSPSSDGVGHGNSYGVSSHKCVGGESVDERAARGGGGACLRSRRFPLFGAAISRGLPFGEPGGAGRVSRDMPASRPGDSFAVTWWLALATVLAVPVVAVVVDYILK